MRTASIDNESDHTPDRRANEQGSAQRTENGLAVPLAIGIGRTGHAGSERADTHTQQDSIPQTVSLAANAENLAFRELTDPGLRADG
jgi:hypothetical protein